MEKTWTNKQMGIAILIGAISTIGGILEMYAPTTLIVGLAAVWLIENHLTHHAH